jgi:hypothetical protein
MLSKGRGTVSLKCAQAQELKLRAVTFMQFDSAKLKEAVLYTCSKGKPLTAVKLHKVLYLTDMLHYVDSGAPMTGATYRKRAYGPTCDQLFSVLTELSQTGQIEIRESDYFGYRKKEYVAQQLARPQRLGDSEIALLDEVIDFVCANNTATMLSDLSHNRACDAVEFGEVIPYRSAFSMFPIEVSPEALDWAQSEAERIADRKRRAQ